jgi:microcystin-dependent protein
MIPLPLVLTNAGLSRIARAHAGEPVDLTVAAIALSGIGFVAAPTLTAVPGEFRRVTTVSGARVGEAVAHMVVRDSDPVGYDVRGFGIILGDGTIFATYAQPGMLVQKSPQSSLHFAIDVAFTQGVVADLVFGDTVFLNPPATENMKGVVQLATIAEGRAGTDPLLVPSVAVVRDMIGDYLPIGAITLWAPVGAVPSGWAICDGRTVERSDGAGEITTPDLRGRVPVGAGGAREPGDAFGAASKTVDTERAGEHAHDGTVTVSDGYTNITATLQKREVDDGNSANGLVEAMTLNDPGHTHQAGVSIASAGDHAHAVTVDVTQPSLALFFIMRV